MRASRGFAWTRLAEGPALPGEEVGIAIAVAAVRQPPG